MRSITSFLPHQFPFIFVDKVILADKERFITEKRPVIFPDSSTGYHYPKSLLIEHAAQTMFIHGYYIGLCNNWWDESYQPVGFLTGISEANFSMEKYEKDDSLYTQTEVIRICKPMIIVKTNVWKDGDILLFSGIINGIFTSNCNYEKSSTHSNIGKYVDTKYFDHDEKGYFFNSNNWFLPGHFPEFSCYPGCLVLEGLAQTTGINAQITNLKKIKFRKAMVPDMKYYYKKKTEEDHSFNFEIIEDGTNEICAEGILSLAS
jgi:3-hydroxymyristoyl/3-hydroxydecanoyl-(acyl carrier protein) dehydratase